MTLAEADQHEAQDHVNAPHAIDATETAAV